MAKADFELAKRQFPSTAMGIDQWVAAFDADPDIMWKILADVYGVVRDEMDRANGKYRIGRRPVRAAGSVEELRRIAIPAQFSSDPFSVALKTLMAGRSQRQFAPRVPVSQATLFRLLSGETIPDLLMMERIAVAGKVSPFFFVEYRARFISEMVSDVLTRRPNLGITAYKRYRDGVRRLDD